MATSMRPHQAVFLGLSEGKLSLLFLYHVYDLRILEYAICLKNRLS